MVLLVWRSKGLTMVDGSYMGLVNTGICPFPSFILTPKNINMGLILLGVVILYGVGKILYLDNRDA